MEYVCQHEGCSNGAALPDEYEAAQAVAEVMECTAVKAPDGIQFFCKAHRNHALHRMRKLGLLDEPKPPEPPKLAPEAIISEPPVENGIIDYSQFTMPNQCELIVVCQKGRILGVFSDKEKAGGIRRMAESLSPEPVYCQHWQLDTPGAQIMEEPEPPADDTPFRCTKCHKPVPVDRMECEHCSKKGAPDAVQKEGRKKRKRNEPQPAKEEG
jgi:hypothetical protein